MVDLDHSRSFFGGQIHFHNACGGVVVVPLPCPDQTMWPLDLDISSPEVPTWTVPPHVVGATGLRIGFGSRRPPLREQCGVDEMVENGVDISPDDRATFGMHELSLFAPWFFSSRGSIDSGGGLPFGHSVEHFQNDAIGEEGGLLTGPVIWRR